MGKSKKQKISGKNVPASDSDMSDEVPASQGRDPQARSSTDTAALFALVQNGFKQSNELVAGLAGKIEQLELNTSNKFQQVGVRMDQVETNLGARITKLEEDKHDDAHLDIGHAVWPKPSFATSGEQHNKSSSSMEHGPVQSQASPSFPPQVASPSFPPQVVPDAPTYWDRLPDPSILCVSTLARAKVSRKAVEDCLLLYFVECGYNTTDFQVDGPDVGNTFKAHFFGADIAASSRYVKNCLQMQKQSDGSYKRFSVLDPSGAQVQIFINPDKNGHQIKTESCTNRLCKLIKGKCPNVPVYPRKLEGILSSDFQVLAVLRIAKDKVSIDWNIKLCKSRNLDYEAIGASFLEEENIQWATSS